MAEGYDGNDSGRGSGPSVVPTPKGRALADRRARERERAQGTATPTATPTVNEASNVRRIRSEESPPEVANELGFRDTTVMADDVPPSERPKSHKRKVVSQEPEPKAPPIPFDPNLSNLLLGLAQGMFTAAWGPDAAFTAKERELIQPPLARLMQRLSPEDGARFSAMADPVFLAAGLLIWGMRIWTMQQKAVKPAPATASRPTGPVVQGMPSTESMVGHSADQIVTTHEPASERNGTATVHPDIAANWGTI